MYTFSETVHVVPFRGILHPQVQGKHNDYSDEIFDVCSTCLGQAYLNQSYPSAFQFLSSCSCF